MLRLTLGVRIATGPDPASPLKVFVSSQHLEDWGINLSAEVPPCLRPLLDPPPGPLLNLDSAADFGAGFCFFGGPRRYMPPPTSLVPDPLKHAFDLYTTKVGHKSDKPAVITSPRAETQKGSELHHIIGTSRPFPSHQDPPPFCSSLLIGRVSPVLRTSGALRLSFPLYIPALPATATYPVHTVHTLSEP